MTGKRLWRSPGRILDSLFVPVVCVLIWLRLLDTFGVLNPNLILIALVLIYGTRYAVRERAIGHRFSIGWIGAALLLVLITEWLVYLFSSYRPNSFYALVETIGVFFFYYLIKISRGEKPTAFFIGMTVVGIFHSLGAFLKFIPTWLKLRSLGFEDMTYFKDLLLYGDWVVNALLLLPYPVILFFMFRNQIRKAVFPAVAVFIVSVPILLSFSRGAYIAGAVFLILANAAFLKYRLLRLKTLVLCNAVILFVIVLASLPFAASVYSTTAMFKTASQTRSAASRQETWTESLKLVRENPVTGVGSYNFALRFMAIAPYDETKGVIRTPQNTAIGIAADKGLIGVAAYVLLLAAIIGTGVTRLAKAKESFDKAALVSIVSGIVAAAVYLTTYYASLGNQGTAFLAAAAMALLDGMKLKE
ncbi:MAG: O-antigen ligase family protein [Acidobacteria bacterium]|nr:O-antigen ligase family protein [Acidobacteriota bacterium]